MKRKTIKYIVTVVVVMIVATGLVVYQQLQRFGKEIGGMEINNIDLTQVEDGVFVGEYIVNEMVGAKLEVFVKDNKITEINILEHRYGLGQKAEELINKVIELQRLEVDTISGATGSSKVLLKAIENALTK